MLNQITAFGIISFINFLSTVILGSFAFLKGRKSDVKIAYSIFAYTLAFYAFFYFLWQSSSDATWAITLFKWTIVGVVLINSSFFNFTYNLLNMHKKHKGHLYFVHIINLFFCYGALNLFYDNWKIKYTYGLWPVPSLVFHIYLIWWFGQVIWCFYLIWKKGIVEATGKQRQQCKWVLASCFIGYVGGATNWFVWYGINFPPYMNGGVALYALILGYAVLRHRLLDIEVVIRKTLIFAGLFAMAMIVVSIVSTITRGYIGRYVSINADISTLISVLIALAFYKPTGNFLVAITDKFLFQKKSEIKVILNRLSEQVITIIDIEQIGKTILSTLEETLRLESGMIFFQNKKARNYRMLEHFGMTGDDLTGSIGMLLENPSIINYFSNRGMSILNLDHPEKRIGLPPAVVSWLKTSKSRVCIPLSINEEQFGLMALGKKKSDQEFTQEEMDYFPTIASQTALAIRNARLVETVVQEREAKVRAEHLAKRVEFAGLIKHEIQNKLVHIEMPANATATYCVPRLRKWFKEQDEKRFSEICDEIAKGSKDINLAADHIRIIAQTAKGGVDEKDESFQELDFKLIWEDAKKESGLLKLCDFESNMPQRFFVYGNYHALQRTFINLIRNAYDAMKDKNEPLIKLRCSYRDIEAKRVAYFEVEDSGCGIPKEVEGKIFENGFSTKPKPDAKDLLSSGHGQGLAACKLYVESIHNGKMWFESEVGKGTTFKFWVPMTEKDAKSGR